MEKNSPRFPLNGNFCDRFSTQWKFAIPTPFLTHSKSHSTRRTHSRINCLLQCRVGDYVLNISIQPREHDVIVAQILAGKGRLAVAQVEIPHPLKAQIKSQRPDILNSLVEPVLPQLERLGII